MPGRSDTGTFDVAVVGAGPSGSATARQLAQRGVRVALVERTRFEAPRIGETLAPDVQEPLRRLGLWDRFMRLRPLPSWGTLSIWGSDELLARSHMFSPYGCGWHVDRRAFDEMLARSAAEAGACLCDGMSVRRAVWQGDGWRLELRPTAAAGCEAAPTPLLARVLVDATGRRAQLARGLGARLMCFDRLVGVAATFADTQPRDQAHLLLEATPDGWWYSAPIPAGAVPGEASLMVAILMTDGDLSAGSRLRSPDLWEDRLAATVATRARLDGARRRPSLRIHCARSQYLLGRQGLCRSGTWLSVGDATLAVDPLSGSGVLRALRSAQDVGGVVFDVLQRPQKQYELISGLLSASDRQSTQHLVERAQYYAAEARFASPFWHRRKLAGHQAKSSIRASRTAGPLRPLAT